MNKIKLTLIAGIIGIMTLTGFGATNELFKSGFSVQLATTYQVDKGHAFKDKYDINFNGGLQYYFNSVIGIEANLPFYKSSGTVFDSVAAGVLIRVPISHIAPYVGIGTLYNWNNDKVDYYAKGGIEFAPNDGYKLFIESIYTINDLNKYKDGSIGLNAGVRLNF